LKHILTLGNIEFESCKLPKIEIKQGEVTVLLGSSFPQKIFDHLLLIKEMDQLKIDFFDPFIENPETRRKNIGFVFSHQGLISNLSLLHNVDLPARYHGIYGEKQDLHFARKSLKDINIPEEQWGLRPHMVNSETRKLTLFARSIVMAPRILLIKDPTFLISYHRKKELQKWIHLQKKNRAIIIGTDDYYFSTKVADQLFSPSEKKYITDKEKISSILGGV